MNIRVTTVAACAIGLSACAGTGQSADEVELFEILKKMDRSMDESKVRPIPRPLFDGIDDTSGLINQDLIHEINPK